MMLKANFNISTQCPQVYIYIFAVITSTLLSLKLESMKEAAIMATIGVVTTILLMGINYCEWYFQFITWIISFFYIMIAVLNIVVFFFDSNNSEKNKM